MNDTASNKCSLADKKCLPCTGAVEPLKADALKQLLGQLESGWELIQEHHIEKQYKFKDFKEALDFVNKIGVLAEEQGHHPDVFLAWGKVKLQLWTHKIKGLHESDFVFAAKADRLYKPVSD
ncbi:MAG: 4a-hydroxytetrahydrobiopterin dehydratase [Phycisphaerae bacterium]